MEDFTPFEMHITINNETGIYGMGATKSEALRAMIADGFCRLREATYGSTHTLREALNNTDSDPCLLIAICNNAQEHGFATRIVFHDGPNTSRAVDATEGVLLDLKGRDTIIEEIMFVLGNDKQRVILKITNEDYTELPYYNLGGAFTFGDYTGETPTVYAKSHNIEYLESAVYVAALEAMVDRGTSLEDTCWK